MYFAGYKLLMHIKFFGSCPWLELTDVKPVSRQHAAVVLSLVTRADRAALVREGDRADSQMPPARLRQIIQWTAAGLLECVGGLAPMFDHEAAEQARRYFGRECMSGEASQKDALPRRGIEQPVIAEEDRGLRQVFRKRQPRRQGAIDRRRSAHPGSSPVCSLHNPAYRPLCCRSSSCVPDSTMRPSSSTWMRCA